MGRLASEDHNDQRSENNPSLVDHSVDELAKGLVTGIILGARRLVVMTFSVALAVVVLGTTAFAQGNAAQDQYGQEPTPSAPSTAPPPASPPPDPSTAPPTDTPSSPNLQEWYPPPGNSNQGSQPPPGSDQGGQPPNRVEQGGSSSGGSNVIKQIRSFLGSILTGGNLQKQGQPNQRKDSSITHIVKYLNPINDGWVTGIAKLLNPIIGALQSDSPKIDKTGQKKSDNGEDLQRRAKQLCEWVPNTPACLEQGVGQDRKPVIPPDPPKGLIYRLATKDGRDAVSACLETGGPAIDVVGKAAKKDIPVDVAILFIKVAIPLYFGVVWDVPELRVEGVQALRNMLATKADQVQLILSLSSGPWFGPPNLAENPPLLGSDLIKAPKP